MTKITIERETLKWAIRWHESRIWPGPDEVSVFDALRAALAQKAEPPSMPPGMALMPIEPTPGIITTGTVALMKASDSDLDATREEIAATYRAMIAAAGDKI